MEATKIGVVIVSLVLVVGLGMFVFNSYTGALVSTGSFDASLSSNRQCDNTDSLDDAEDGLEFDTVYKNGKVKVKLNPDDNFVVVHEDACSSNNVLNEGYCNGLASLSTTIVTCEHGCNGGKCNLVSCVDNDNGLKYLTASSTSGIMIDDPDFLGAPPSTQDAKIYTDSCSGVTLNEYYCSSGFVKNKPYECQNGCNGGKCNEIVASSAPATKYCEENKPDNSIFIKAGVRTKVGSGFWSSYTHDYCNGNTLVDYFCNVYKNMEAKQVACSYGCSNGACNYPPCTDPDAFNPNPSRIKTTVTGLRNEDSFGVPPSSQIKSYTDECTGSDSIREYKCNGGKVQVTQGPCLPDSNFVCDDPDGDCSGQSVGSSGYYLPCKNGACVAP